MKNQKVSTCAKVLVNEYVSCFGAPESLHSDQGGNFESSVFNEMCDLFEIEKTRTTAYHPHDWDDKLPSALMAYRSSVHESSR
jgi:hypothetical protein